MMKIQVDTAGTMKLERQHRAALRTLARELQDVHRELVEVSRGRYEAANGPLRNSNELLQLLLNDETFTWLRSLSSLIVEIDERAAQDPDVTAVEAKAMGSRVRALISSSGDPNALGSRYVALLTSEPRVTMSHLGVRAALADLAETQAAEPERSGNDGHAA